MAQATLATLGTLVRKHRGNKTLRDAGREIGVGHATLIRVESGRVPDVETFGKICKWLGRDPGEFLGFRDSKTEGGTGTAELPILLSVHLRAAATQHPDTVAVLAKMMLLATQRQKLTVDPDAKT
jgi:transcriptional regulator with XRE-family HTH domain